MGSMSHRPASELMQSLRGVLQKLEKNFSSLEDQPMFAELRRLILLYIADLEFVENAELADAKGAQHQGAVLPSVVQIEPETA